MAEKLIKAITKGHIIHNQQVIAEGQEVELTKEQFDYLTEQELVEKA